MAHQETHHRDQPTGTTLSLDDIIPAKRLPDVRPDLFRNYNAVQWTIRTRHERGLAPAFIKIGREWLVNLPELARCMAMQAGK